MKTDFAGRARLESLLDSLASATVQPFHNGHQVIDTINVSYGELTNRQTLVHPRASVHPTAILGDGVIILARASVGPFSFLRRNVIVMEDATIGFSVELDRCVIGRRAKIAHASCVGRCVVGDDCNLGYGFVVATRRLDGKEILGCLPDGSFVRTEGTHHGCVLGSGIRAGVMVAVMPGASVAPQVVLPPRAVVAGWHNA